MLAQRFRDYRKRMRLTQKELSHKSGLSAFTISGFEKGSGTGITMASFIKLLSVIISFQ
ncbi:helix-turn-helix domain-containing protein [Marinilabilia salmonicolor]|uniref:helix-turn-helix domain-containing protein n=1 Tax=Marinilabilia salmonicolor TaxID=989 RepID=UPI0021D1659E|nr:helix-turn-helix domain-containing protein [Marinilabilia salmonicolor]